MRPRDFVDYFRLRRLVRDAGAVRRWGMHSAPGEDREVVFHDGRRLLLRGGYRDYHIFDRIFLQDTYRLANLPARLGCVLDVGANIGLFACCVAPRAERVVCFEPSPGNFALLERNTAGLAHVAARQEAMAGEGGEALLHVPVDGHNTGAFSLFESDEARADAADVTVPTVTLEAVLDREGIERFCEQIAGAIHTSRLLENEHEARQEAEEAKSRIEEMSDFQRQLVSLPSLERQLERIFTYLENNFDIDAAFLQIYEPGKSELFFYKASASSALTALISRSSP